MNTPRPSAHRNAVIPGSMLGGRKCIAGIVISWGNLPVSPDPFHWSAPRTGDFVAGPKKFAEPVSRSSTASADLPLPGTAFGLGFDLLALRARRKQHTNASSNTVKGSKKDVAAICGKFFFQHFHSRSCN